VSETKPLGAFITPMIYRVVTDLSSQFKQPFAATLEGCAMTGYMISTLIARKHKILVEKTPGSGEMVDFTDDAVFEILGPVAGTGKK
jgi:hypothetical protein